MNQVQIISLSLAGLVDFSHWSAMNFDLVDFYVYWICRVCCLDSLCFLPNSPLVNFEFLASTPHWSVINNSDGCGEEFFNATKQRSLEDGPLSPCFQGISKPSLTFETPWNQFPINGLYTQIHLYILCCMYIIYNYIYNHIYVYVYIYILIYMCIYIYIYLYIYMSGERVWSPQCSCWLECAQCVYSWTRTLLGGLWNVHNFCETCTTAGKRAQHLWHVHTISETCTPSLKRETHGCIYRGHTTFRDHWRVSNYCLFWMNGLDLRFQLDAEWLWTVSLLILMW